MLYWVSLFGVVDIPFVFYKCVGEKFRRWMENEAFLLSWQVRQVSRIPVESVSCSFRSRSLLCKAVLSPFFVVPCVFLPV